MDKFWHFFGVFLPFWHFSTIFDNMDQCLLSIVKDDNPWDVSSLYDFNYYCCPECDSKSQNKQDFINHASNNHPWVSKCCFLGTNTRYLMAKWIFYWSCCWNRWRSLYVNDFCLLNAYLLFTKAVHRKEELLGDK